MIAYRKTGGTQNGTRQPSVSEKLSRNAKYFIIVDYFSRKLAIGYIRRKPAVLVMWRKNNSSYICNYKETVAFISLARVLGLKAQMANREIWAIKCLL